MFYKPVRMSVTQIAEIFGIFSKSWELFFKIATRSLFIDNFLILCHAVEFITSFIFLNNFSSITPTIRILGNLILTKILSISFIFINYYKIM